MRKIIKTSICKWRFNDSWEDYQDIYKANKNQLAKGALVKTEEQIS